MEHLTSKNIKNKWFLNATFHFKQDTVPQGENLTLSLLAAFFRLRHLLIQIKYSSSRVAIFFLQYF